MTLSTDIYITGTGVTMREAYEKVNDLLEIPDTRLFDETPTSICNQIGQGFPAIVAVSAAADGSLVTPTCDQWCVDDLEPGETCTWHSHTEPHHVHVDLDTGYAYRDSRGWGCSQLHAWVILALADWLSPKGCTLRWVNEYAGTIHDANDTKAFTRFVGNGASADAWFIGSALPSILAHATTEQRS